MSQNFFNAATQIVTIYDPAGKPHKATRLNALDLIRTNGFSWNAPGDAAAEPEPEAEPAVVASAPEVTEEAAEDTVAEPEDEPEATFDVKTAPLADVALMLTGGDDVAKYLSGFTPDALKTMADERFGQKLHHRLSKESMIERIVQWEAEKIASESSEV